MTDLLEDHVAGALRAYALDVAPPLAHDPQRVLRIGHRRRAVRSIGGAAAVVVGLAFVGVGVAEVATPRTQVVDIAGWFAEPAPEDVIKELGAAFANPDPFPYDDVELPFDESTARFVGNTGKAQAYVGTNAAGEICLFVMAIDPEGEWVTALSCAAPSRVAERGLGLGLGLVGGGGDDVWLVPDNFGEPPEGWLEHGPNLWARAPSYEVNDNGQTYGPLLGNSPETQPDLILVETDDGQEGYAYAVDLEGPMPYSPEEALQWQEEERFANRSIPVYLSDGTTRIGTFTQGR